MKTPMFTSLIIALFAPAALASPAETELRTLVQQITDAYVKSDTDFLKSAYAEEATFVNLDGTTTSKTQDLSDLIKRDAVFTSVKMTEVKVRMLGEDHALVTGVTHGRGKYKGDSFDITSSDAVCFEKQGGRWRCIYWQSTELKPPER